MNFKPTFIPSEVVKSFLLDELGQTNKHCAFLERISHTQQDQAILSIWINHFTKHKVPWALTQSQRDNIFRLWKIDETLTAVEARAENDKPSVNWFMERTQGEMAQLRELEGKNKEPMGECVCEGCSDDAVCNGLCPACYNRKHKWEAKGLVFDFVRKKRAGKRE